MAAARSASPGCSSRWELQLAISGGGPHRGRHGGANVDGPLVQAQRPSRNLPRASAARAYRHRAPESCPCCGSTKLPKLGERKKFSCGECENITQPPAPFYGMPRGFAGPNQLAVVLFEKFGQHQPLSRQSERYAREGIDLSLSTLADQAGSRRDGIAAADATIEDHVLAAERLHGDETTCPSWQRARRLPAGPGSMSVTTGLFADQRRRRP
jgi:hypothetical protein